MAVYRPPTFNLICDIYSMVGLLPVLRAIAVPVQLYNPWRNNTGGQEPAQTVPATQSAFASIILRFPAFTDVRSQWCSPTGRGDQIECPSGSGVFYIVSDVNDVAKGFPNEYRAALCTIWRPTPVPLP